MGNGTSLFFSFADFHQLELFVYWAGIMDLCLLCVKMYFLPNFFIKYEQICLVRSIQWPLKHSWCVFSVFMKIIGHIRHFRWLGPNVWWEISQIWIEYIKPIGQMSEESWKFFGYTVFLPEASFGLQILSFPASVPVCVCLSVSVYVCQPRACLHHNPLCIQAWTTKFGQNMENNLVKVPIVLEGDWPWPSRSNLTWKAKFTPFWAWRGKPG